VFLDRVAALLPALDTLGRSLADLDTDPLHLLHGCGICRIPGLAGNARQRLARYRPDGILILLGQFVPLVLIHEKAEGGAVEAAGKKRRIFDDRAKLEGENRLGGGEYARGAAPAARALGISGPV